MGPTRRRLRIEKLEPRHLLAADPIINEFLASNDLTNVDGNGNSSDWIEIYNRGDTVAQLENYYLTDNSGNLTKWQFPSGTTLAAGDRMLVFASGDGVPDLLGNLHTSYKLSAGGEYVALVDMGMNVVSEFGPNGQDYPEQFTDVSYGIDSLGNTGFFFTPTPNAPNGISTPTYNERVVNFSRSSGVFSESSFALVLTADAPNSQIVYTLDGSVPTATSSIFNTSITISNSTNVRARVLLPGNELGPTFGAAYTELINALDNRTSNLPIVVLDNFGGGEVGDDFSDFSFSLFDVDPNTGVSSLQSAPEVSTNSGLHIRGTSSASFDKKQYRLELRDQLGEDADFSLVGLPEESDWVLFGPYVDKSLIRNPLAFELGRGLGLEAPNTRFVEVYLNQGNGSSVLSDNDYVGTYTIRENIKVGDNRVDIAELDASDTTEPDISGGYLLRFDPNLQPEDIILDTGGETDLALVNSEDYTAAQKTWITNHINEFLGVLNGPNFADPVNGYAKYIDVDSFVNLMVLNELFRDQDAYFRSNYLYKDRDGKLTQGPLWDYNLSTGVGCCRNNREIEGWQYEENGGFIATQWYGRLLQDPNFELKFRDHWAKTRQSIFSLENINSVIDGFVSEIGVSADRNFNRWDILDQAFFFTSPITNTYVEQIDILKQWIADRIAWIDSQLLTNPSPPVISPGSGTVTAGATVRLTAIASIIDIPVVSQGSPALAFVPTDNSLETGPGPQWHDLGFDTTGWISGTNGVGYENSEADYDALIGTDVQTAWDALIGAPQGESSVYSRFGFTLPQDFDVDEVFTLALEVTSDDAFVAYLNGIEVKKSARAPETVHWQANATEQINDNLVIANPEVFDISNFKQHLQAGDNVLAIHGLNINDTSSDLLILPKLLLGEAGALAPVYFTTDGSDPRNANGTPAGTLYNGPIAINEDTVIKARALVGNDWSALSTASLLIETADFDSDQDIDGRDFLTWQRNLGKSGDAVLSDGDANRDLNVDALDLGIWNNQYGQSAGPLVAFVSEVSSASAASSFLLETGQSVPDPSSTQIPTLSLDAFYGNSSNSTNANLVLDESSITFVASQSIEHLEGQELYGDNLRLAQIDKAIAKLFDDEEDIPEQEEQLFGELFSDIL